jgi:hypothetical protein
MKEFWQTVVKKVDMHPRIGWYVALIVTLHLILDVTSKFVK